MVVRNNSCCGVIGEPHRCNTICEIALCFFVVLVIDRFNVWWSEHKYGYATICLRVFLRPFMAICGSDEACVRAPMTENYERESRVFSSR